MRGIWFRGWAAIILSALLCSTASAGFISILNVDFNDNSPTTTGTDANGVGFRSFDVSESPTKTFGGLNPTLTSGAVTVALSNLYGGFRDRGVGGMSGPFRDLYRDFVPFGGPNSLAAALSLSGLNPNTDYALTFQSFDLASDHPGTTLYTDVTPGGYGERSATL